MNKRNIATSPYDLELSNIDCKPLASLHGYTGCPGLLLFAFPFSIYLICTKVQEEIVVTLTLTSKMDVLGKFLM